MMDISTTPTSRNYIVLNSMYRDRSTYPSPCEFECSNASYQDTLIDAYTMPIVQVDLSDEVLMQTGTSYIYSLNGVIIAPDTAMETNTLVIQLPQPVNLRTQFILEYNRFTARIRSSRKLGTLLWELILDEPLFIDIFLSSTVLVRSGYLTINSQVYVPYYERDARLFQPTVPDSYFVGYWLIDVDTGNQYNITAYNSYNSQITFTPSTASVPIVRYVIVQSPSPFPIVTASLVDPPLVTFVPTLQYIPYVHKLYAYNLSTRSIFEVTLQSVTSFTYLSGTVSIGDRIYLSPVRAASYPMLGSIRALSPIMCKRMECIGLYVPNMPIESSKGGTLTSYPYLMIEISQPQLSSSMNVFYQNTPYYQTFICPMRDIASNEESAFIRIDGGMTRHNMVIYENQPIHVRILTPDNQVVRYTRQDTPYPCPSDPYAQTTLVFMVQSEHVQ
jgi:hypothetical protein